jgi:hypothetical protein
LTALADAALRVLARQGTRVADGPGTSRNIWTFEARTPEGTKFEIRCAGPDLPDAIPAQTVFPADIPKDPDWQGRYRLIVAPPLVALDISWTPGEPLRIMYFSRGDWEDQLLRIAQ